MLREIFAELKEVVFQRGGFIDAFLPPILFVVVQALWSFQAAMWGALAVAVLLGGFRLLNGQNVLYALGGAAGVLLAIGLTRLLGGEENFFLPTLLTNALTVFLCVVSVLARRPLVAWTSFIARRWPRDWYWHPKVRPAYAEVTLFWAVYFLAQFAAQLYFYLIEAEGQLAWLNVVLGWPATILLLVISYLYGTWRLQNLKGPSVEEFEAGADPPWQSQRKGF
jgi:hypothetical protein